jgi:uncharacterized protein (DUF58 family)
MPPESKLIDHDLMKMLERLNISSRKLFPGAMKGKRRSVKRGSSVEFADYRDYQPGDDFRFIDWNIYARLNKLFLKTFVEEENIYIHILLDTSPSMSFGTPSKLEYGKKIVAALGYIGLVNLDMVVMTAFSDNLSGLRPMRGKDQIFTLLNFLTNIPASEPFADNMKHLSANLMMSNCLKKYAIRTPYRGVAIIISDFLVPQNVYEEGLKALLYKNFDVKVIQLLSEDELNPDLSGELKLQDSETGETKEITINDKVLKKYQSRLEMFCGNLKEFCTMSNVAYLRIITGLPFDELILKTLRKERLLV